MRFGKARQDKMPELGALEVDVLKQLWASPENLDARKVLERLEGRSISLSTVQATLERLCRKRLVARTKISRAYFYRASVSREQLISMLIGDVTHRLAEGELEPVISGFIELIDSTDPRLLDRVEDCAKRRRKKQ
jgi:predicted transcriptional regulator